MAEMTMMLLLDVRQLGRKHLSERQRAADETGDDCDTRRGGHTLKREIVDEDANADDDAQTDKPPFLAMGLGDDDRESTPPIEQVMLHTEKTSVAVVTSTPFAPDFHATSVIAESAATMTNAGWAEVNIEATGTTIATPAAAPAR